MYEFCYFTDFYLAKNIESACIESSEFCKKLTFNWSPVGPNCLGIHYNILSSNSGSCPTTTTNTTVTCTDVPTDGTVCTFTVQTVVCGNIYGTMSHTVQVKLKNDAIKSDLGAIVSACLFAGLFVVSTSILVIIVIVILIKRCKYHTKVEADQDLSTRHYNAVSYQPKSSAAVDTEANIAYGL